MTLSQVIGRVDSALLWLARRVNSPRSGKHLREKSHVGGHSQLGGILAEELSIKIADRILAITNRWKSSTNICKCFEQPENFPIPLANFVHRVISGTNKYTKEEDSDVYSVGIRCALMAVEYIERLQVKVSQGTALRLFLAAFVISFKATDDYRMETSWWAHLGGCGITEIHEMELNLCSLLNWNIAMPEPAFHALQKNLITCT